MLKESYIANWRNLPKDAVIFRVARPSVLGPSKELLKDYKANKINWEQYEERFRKEILSNEKAMNKLRYIKLLSKERDVYLVCYEKEYPCHRFILIDIIKNLKL